jgi:hypothetical protein
MLRIWLTVGALAWVVMAADAGADTVYLKDGQSVWGKEAYEEGDSVVVVRPGGDLRFPKAEVSRIEPTRSTLPPFYSPPAEPPASAAGPEGPPGVPAPPGGPQATPLPPGGAPLPVPPGGPSPVTPPPGTGPTQLPPPPAPPPPGAYAPPR